MDLAIESFYISVEPFLCLACKAGAHVIDLQLDAGLSQQTVHFEPPQNACYEDLELFEV